jgi:hypothetical protein
MLFLPLLLTADDPMAGILAGPELLPAGHGLGSNCSECFLSRGLSVKLRGLVCKRVAVISCGCMFYLEKFVSIHRKIQKWQN